MKKVLWLIVCFMTMVISVNAHNVHYPTYTIDGITYVKSGVSDRYIDGCRYELWDILKVDKPYDKTIIIPYMLTINEKKVAIFSIRENAFSACVSLDSLIISDGMYLTENSFIGCKTLEYLYYSSNCSSWSLKNKHTYYPNLSCKTLETTCGVLENTFWESIKETLETLIIKDISCGVFTRMDNCKKLKTIVSHSINPPSSFGTKNVYQYSCLGEVYFNSNQWAKITLYVPRESLEKYYFDKVWGEIDNIYAIDEMDNETTSISAVTNNASTNDVWFSLNGIKIDKPTKGIYIKNGKKYILK